jgi:hypothetical protein
LRFGAAGSGCHKEPASGTLRGPLAPGNRAVVRPSPWPRPPSSCPDYHASLVLSLSRMNEKTMAHDSALAQAPPPPLCTGFSMAHRSLVLLRSSLTAKPADGTVRLLDLDSSQRHRLAHHEPHQGPVHAGLTSLIPIASINTMCRRCPVLCLQPRPNATRSRTLLRALCSRASALRGHCWMRVEGALQLDVD